MKEYLHLIDIHTLGPRCDVTPLFAHPAAFAQLVMDLSYPFQSIPVDFVAGIDALGFILGTAIAIHLQKGFIPIRKAGKLPVETVKRDFIDYSGSKKILEIRKGILPESANVLLVDEWIETGAQVQAAIALVEAEGGVVVGITTINIDANPLTQLLRQRYTCHALWFGMQEPE